MVGRWIPEPFPSKVPWFYSQIAGPPIGCTSSWMITSDSAQARVISFITCGNCKPEVRAGRAAGEEQGPAKSARCQYSFAPGILDKVALAAFRWTHPPEGSMPILRGDCHAPGALRRDNAKLHVPDVLRPSMFPSQFDRLRVVGGKSEPFDFCKVVRGRLHGVGYLDVTQHIRLLLPRATKLVRQRAARCLVRSPVCASGHPRILLGQLKQDP